jgi:hypothetical protein
MNFFTHRILNPAGNGPSFDEWVQNYIQKLAAEKSASEKKATKEMGECNNAGKVTEEHGDAASAEPSVSQKINNDPCYQKGESTDPSKAKGKSKKGPDDPVAGGKTAAKKPIPDFIQEKIDAKKNKGKDTDKKDDGKKVEAKVDNDKDEPKGNINNEGTPKMTNDPKLPKDDCKKCKKASSDPVFKKVASLNRAEKLRLFASLSANKSNPIQYVEAMVGMKFANMTDEEKTWFKKFWSVLYPEAYVSEMVKDR